MQAESVKLFGQKPSLSVLDSNPNQDYCSAQTKPLLVGQVDSKKDRSQVLFQQNLAFVFGAPFRCLRDKLLWRGRFNEIGARKAVQSARICPLA